MVPGYIVWNKLSKLHINTVVRLRYDGQCYQHGKDRLGGATAKAMNSKAKGASRYML